MRYQRIRSSVIASLSLGQTQTPPQSQHQGKVNLEVHLAQAWIISSSLGRGSVHIQDSMSLVCTWTENGRPPNNWVLLWRPSSFAGFLTSSSSWSLPSARAVAMNVCTCSPSGWAISTPRWTPSFTPCAMKTSRRHSRKFCTFVPKGGNKGMQPKWCFWRKWRMKACELPGTWAFWSQKTSLKD